MVTTENNNIHKIVSVNRKVKISNERVGFILHVHLSMTTLFAKYVLRLFTVNQKQHRVNDESYLELYWRDRTDSLHQDVSVDETWIHN